MMSRDHDNKDFTSMFMDDTLRGKDLPDLSSKPLSEEHIAWRKAMMERGIADPILTQEKPN